MTRGQQLLRSSTSTLASQVANALISILFIAYFARAFSREQMAIYAIMSMFASWNEIVGGLGMHTLMVRDAAQLKARGDHNGVNLLISSVLVYRTCALALTSLVWFLTSPLTTAHSFSEPSSLGLVEYAVVIAFFMSCRSELSAVQTALERFGRQAVINTGTVFMQRLFSVIGYFTFGVQGFFTGYLVSTIASALWTAWDIRQFLTWQRLPFSTIFRQSRGLWGIKFIRGALDHLDRPLILSLMSAELLGVYFVAKRLYENLYNVVTSISVPIGVKFGEVKIEGNQALRSFFNKSCLINAQIFIPVSAVLMVTAHPLLSLYGGEKYGEASAVLAAFGFTLIGVSFWSLMREASLRLLETRHLAIQYVSSATVTLVAYFLLVPKLQLVGVPIAMGLGYLAGIYPILVILRKTHDLHLPMSSIGKIFGCAGCIIVIVPLLTLLVSQVVILLIASLILSGFLVLFWLYFVGPRDVNELLAPLYMQIPSVRRLLANRSGGENV